MAGPLLASGVPADVAVFAVVGVLAGAHCLGMCGPLVTLYGDRMARDARRPDALSLHAVGQHALFNLGRAASYAVVGALFAGSVYLMLSRSLVKFVFGLVLISNAANLLIFASGGMTRADLNLDGRETFDLTGVEAGSDASAMTDYGVIVEKEIDGEKKLGVSITCNKRYITLAPIATLAGLAVRLFDPDGLIGPNEDLGITVLLVPTDTEGLETGRRHYPAGIAFQNGPVRGEDVFVPIEQILGGKEQIGQGWKMLMGALAAGRGISLPSLSAAGAAVSARSAGGYARIRQQFGMPVGGFEGVKEKLAPIVATAYTLDGAMLCLALGLLVLIYFGFLMLYAGVT